MMYWLLNVGIIFPYFVDQVLDIYGQGSVSQVEEIVPH